MAQSVGELLKAYSELDQASVNQTVAAIKEVNAALCVLSEPTLNRAKPVMDALKVQMGPMKEVVDHMLAIKAEFQITVI